jgi:hypothetical protein
MRRYRKGDRLYAGTSFAYRKPRSGRSGGKFQDVDSRYMADWNLRLEGWSAGLRTPMNPYVALRGPTYRENSHANHT